MSTINETQDEIIEEFEGLTDWMDRYAYIIGLGNTLPEYPESEKTPANLIEGCQSRVWIDAKLDAEGRIDFRADSDALIVKGIVALLMRGLVHRSPTRSNGLVAMVRQIRDYARAFKALQQA